MSISSKRRGVVTFDTSDVERIADILTKYLTAIEPTIHEYLADHGLETIGPAITRLLPASSRLWDGKRTGAKAAGYASVFQGDLGLGSITVRTQPAYYYLYFPDDGGNTQRHRGNQRFMLHGAEAAAPQLIEGICSRLISKFEEG